MPNIDIFKDIVEAVKKTSTPTTQAYDTPATVTRIEGDVAWVHIPGGVDETPVRLTIAAKAGDTVQLRVGGGTAWLVGNQSAPPTDDTTAIEAKKEAVKAGKTATDFVTDTNNGLFVHPRDNMGDGVRVKDVIEILRGGKTVAIYGDTVRVGEVGKGHIVIDGENFYLYTEEDIESARIGIDDESDSTFCSFGTGNTYNKIEGDTDPVSMIIVGDNNTAEDITGDVSIFGRNNVVGNNGYALGYNNEAYGGALIGNNLYYDYSTGGHAFITPPDGAALVIGCFNRKTADQGDYAFIIGNGSGENDRKDAFKVDWNGGLYSDTRKLFAKDAKSWTSASVGAGATKRESISLAKTGYTPWGIEGIQLTNSNFTYYTQTISGSEAVVYIKNNGSTAATTGIKLDVSFIASSAL